MPSPFPGMDPYLETPNLWEDFHITFLTAIRAQLTRLLPSGFRARIEKHLRTEESSQRLHYDSTLSTAIRASKTKGSVHLLARDIAEEKNPPILIRGFQEVIPQRCIEIVAVGRPLPVVTTIYLLSPANKTSGCGREDYLAKQALWLLSSAHFMEIDLLRAGEYAVAAPADETLRESPYRVSLHRVASEIYEGWPISLQEPLPTVRVPLTAEHPDLYLDLQAALNETLEEAGYEIDLDYSADPLPPIAPQDMTWIDALLRGKGLR